MFKKKVNNEAENPYVHDDIFDLSGKKRLIPRGIMIDFIAFAFSLRAQGAAAAYFSSFPFF